MFKFLEPLINGWYTHLGYFGVVLAMAIESCLIPLPSEIIMPLAGSFTIGATAQFSLIGVALAGAIGCVIGSAIAYWIGATGGRPFLMRYGRYILISRRDIDTADRWFAKYGSAIAFFSRVLPVVRTYISLPAGSSGMNLGKFLLFTFLGSLPWCFALAFAGQQLGENSAQIGNALHGLDAVVIVAIVVLVGLYIYRHVKHEREYDEKLRAAAEDVNITKEMPRADR